MDELLKLSGLIFVGTVIAVDPAASEKNEGTTKVTFRPEKVLKGQPPSEKLSFELPGGPLSRGRTLRIIGAPEFQLGERYLVFVRGGKWYLTPVTNWYHSVFREQVVGNGRYWVSENGRCVTGIDASGFLIGPMITSREQPVLQTKPDSRAGGIRRRRAPHPEDREAKAEKKEDVSKIADSCKKTEAILQAVEAEARRVQGKPLPIMERPAKPARMASQLPAPKQIPAASGAAEDRREKRPKPEKFRKSMSGTEEAQP